MSIRDIEYNVSLTNNEGPSDNESHPPAPITPPAIALPRQSTLATLATYQKSAPLANSRKMSMPKKPLAKVHVARGQVPISPKV